MGGAGGEGKAHERRREGGKMGGGERARARTGEARERRRGGERERAEGGESVWGGGTEIGERAQRIFDAG